MKPQYNSATSRISNPTHAIHKEGSLKHQLGTDREFHGHYRTVMLCGNAHIVTIQILLEVPNLVMLEK